MDNNVFKEFQKLDRKRVYEIRRHGQDGSSVNLPKDEKRLADIMLEHDKEYGNQFEMADLLENYECDINKEVNPFLHIVLHAIVENQLDAKDPNRSVSVL